MATKKEAAGEEPSFMAYMRIQHEKIKALPLVATTYYVEEMRKAYEDNEDQLWLTKYRVVSPYFDSREHEDNKAAALAWIDEHEPDKWDGRETTFVLRKQYLRTYIENKWGPT